MSVISYTRALLVADVRRMLAEKTAGRYADADIERWADEAILDVCTRTRCLRAEATASSVTGQAEYTIPTNFLGSWAITRTTFDGTELNKAAFDAVEELLEPGETLATQKTPRFWCPHGRQIVLVPTPSAVKTIKVWGAKKADALSGDSDTLANLGLDESYGPAIEDFMTHRGLMMAREYDKALAVWQMYERKVGVASDKAMPDAREESSRGAG